VSSALAILCAGVALSITPQSESPAVGPTPAATDPAPQESAAGQPADSAPAPDAQAKPAQPAASDPHAVEAAVIERTNAERVRYGLRPLAVDRLLMRQARQHAAWMTRARVLQHTGAMVAENIAMGQRSSTEAVQCWMNSSGHRANILDPGHTRIGVAAYSTADGTVFWCQQFLR